LAIAFQSWEISHAQSNYPFAKFICNLYLWHIYCIPYFRNVWSDRYSLLLVADALGDRLEGWVRFDDFDSDRAVSKGG
jgi:hypothetical protein